MRKPDGFEGRITEARPSEAAPLLLDDESDNVDQVRVDIRETLGKLVEAMNAIMRFSGLLKIRQESAVRDVVGDLPGLPAADLFKLLDSTAVRLTELRGILTALGEPEAAESVEAGRLPPETKSIVIKHLVPLILGKFNVMLGAYSSKLLAYLLEVGEGVKKSTSELYAYYPCPEDQRDNLRAGFRNLLLRFRNNGLIKLKSMGPPAPQYFSLKTGVIGSLDADELKSALKDAAAEISEKTGSRLSARTIMKYFSTLANLTVVGILSALGKEVTLVNDDSDNEPADEPDGDLEAIETAEQVGWPEAIIDIVTRYLISQSLSQLGIKDTKFHHAFADFLLLKGEGVSSTSSELFAWYGANSRPERTLASQGFLRSMRAMKQSGVVQVTPLPGHTCMESFTLLPGKWPLLEDARWQDAVRQILKQVRRQIRHIWPPFSLEVLQSELATQKRSIPELVAFFRTQRMPANVEAAVVAIDDQRAELAAIGRSLATSDSVDGHEVVASTSVPVIADSRLEVCESTSVPTNGGGDAMLAVVDEDDEPEVEVEPEVVDELAAVDEDDEPEEKVDDDEADLARRIAAREAADVQFPDYVLEQLTNPSHPIHKLGMGKPFRLPGKFAPRMEVCKLLPEGKPLIELLRAFDFDCNAWRQHHVLFYFEGGDIKKPKLRLLHKSAFDPIRNGIPFSGF